jgi:hypothetical protein
VAEQLVSVAIGLTYVLRSPVWCGWS